MKTLIQNWAEFVVNRRWTVIALTILCLGAFTIPMKNLYFDNAQETWLMDGDPAIQQYTELREKFGNSQYLLVGVDAPDGHPSVFNKETLQTIAKITRFLEDHETISKVSSLTKYQYIHSKEDTLYTDDLIEDVESQLDLRNSSGLPISHGQDQGGTDDDGFNEAKNEAEEEGANSEKWLTFRQMAEVMKGETLAHDFLITKDLRHTIISARIEFIEGSLDHHIKLVRDFQRFIEQEKFEELGFKLRITGIPFVNEQMQYNSERDQILTTPLMFLLILIFLTLSFRSFSGVLTPLIVVIGSVIAVMGLIGLFGWALNIVNTVLPLLIMAIGIGDSVHVIVDFYSFRNMGFSPKEASVETVKNLWVPCFNTSLTTSIGFLALSVSKLPPVKEYGVVAAIGIMIAFFISMTTLPALLSFVKTKPKKTQKLIEEGLVARLTHAITPFVYQNRKAIVWISLVIATLSVGFSSQIEVDSNVLHYFKEDSRIRQDALYFDDLYKGSTSLEFNLAASEKGGVKEPQFLRRALAFQDHLESLTEAGKAYSVLNYLRQMNQAMHNDDPTDYRLPDSRDLVAQYLLLYENSSPEEDLTDLKSFDEQNLRITVKHKNMYTSEAKKLVAAIQQEMDTNYKELNGNITGDTMLAIQRESYILGGMAKSLLLALGIIVICFFVLLRSFKYGCLSLIPSLFPLSVVGGLMYLVGRPLEFSTMIVGAITIGITVDDTIHIMTHYIRELRSGNTQMESIHSAITKSGRALVFTSIILYFGFSMNLLSSWLPMIYFGLFTGLIILVALISVIIILPAVIFLIEGKTEPVTKTVMLTGVPMVGGPTPTCSSNTDRLAIPSLRGKG